MATQAKSVAELKALQEAEIRGKKLAARQSEVEKENKGRSGQGLRKRVGMTRGKNPQVIEWEAFDESQKETLPKTSAEFVKLTNTKDEKELVEYLIEGFNSLAYSAASDPIAEFVDYSWPEDIQKGFRLAVRAYSVNSGTSIEDAVELMKPGIEKKVAADRAAAEAAKAEPAATA